MAQQDKNDDYAEHIEHLEATHPEPWPGIRGRSREHESELPTGTPREQQASVTETQRELEQEEPEGGMVVRHSEEQPAQP
jgi:hypothetical protein